MDYKNLIEHLAQAAFEEWRKNGEDLPEWKDMPEEAKTYFRGIAMAVFSRFSFLSLKQFFDLLPEARKEGKYD